MKRLIVLGSPLNRPSKDECLRKGAGGDQVEKPMGLSQKVSDGACCEPAWVCAESALVFALSRDPSFHRSMKLSDPTWTGSARKKVGPQVNIAGICPDNGGGYGEQELSPDRHVLDARDGVQRRPRLELEPPNADKKMDPCGLSVGLLIEEDVGEFRWGRGWVVELPVQDPLGLV